MIRIFIVCAALMAVFSVSAAEQLPLESVRPGMRGEWRTVVSGSEIRSYELEVIGVAHNFIGPQRSVILARALDDEHILSGPVAGMSGSPVYIEGKLVGAYAYGFAWPKEQAVIGITPIDQMLEVLDYSEDQGSASPLPTPAGDSRPDALGGPQSQDREVVPQAATLSPFSSGTLQALPSPLYASGVSQKTLEVFGEAFQELGLEVMQAPMGAASADFDGELEPGAAVAGVLMGGDFNFAAVGTVTWRDGGRLLAFGHPFMSLGPLELPMAEAEVLTVVQTLPRSFKLANVGEVVGTIYQDRLTAVAGEIGRETKTAPVVFNIHGPGESTRSLRGDVFQHRDLTPLLAAVALLESLTQTTSASEEQTVYVDFDLSFEGYEPVKYQWVGSGPSGAISLAMGLMSTLREVLANPFETPRLESIECDIRVRDEWEITGLRMIRDLSGPVYAGETVQVEVELLNLLDEPIRHTLDVPIPANVAGEELTLFFGDARAADRVDSAGGTYGALDEILDTIRERRSNHNLYVKLLRKAPGLRIEGRSLQDLPPTVARLLESPRTRVPRQSLDTVTVWETAVEVPGAFTGLFTFPIQAGPARSH